MCGPDLYVGGEFTTAGGTVVNRVTKWDGSVWSPLGSGMNGYVHALVVSGSDLYAGGRFTTADGTTVNYVAKWNGNAWSALGSGMDFYVYALAVSGVDLYAGGDFITAGGSAANRIAKWNGSSWSALGSGVSSRHLLYPYIYSLAVSGPNLYVGGEFTTAGNKVSAYVAKANIGGFGGRFDSLAYSPATGFHFTFSDATTGQLYRIQASSSPTGGSWTDFTNFTYTGPLVITDASAVPTTNKFYRAVTP